MLHLFKWDSEPGRLHQVGACLCLCVALLVAGCGYPGPSPAIPYTLPQLHIPQLRWLPALSRIPTADGTQGGQIYDLTTFQRPGSATPLVILSLDGDLELSGIYGSGGQRLLAMGAPCYGPAAVTPDGRWVACVSFPDNTDGSNRLQMAALSPTGASQPRQIQLSPDPFYSNLVWSPDGQYLAVVLNTVYQGCDVAIFSSSPPHTTFTRAVTLTSPQFSDQQGACLIDSLAWPIDGQRLLVFSDMDPIIGTGTFVATVPVLPLLYSFAISSPQQVVTQTVASDQVRTLPIDTYYLRPWLLTPQADTLLYITQDTPERLMSLNLQTKQTKSLFTFPDTFQIVYEIKALALTPDRSQLLLVIGDRNPCVDCGRYAISDVYLYTLADAPADAVASTP